jgi:hypothetical protein
MNPTVAPSLPSVPTPPDPAELTPAEVDALERAEQLDSGTLAEQLADAGHAIAFDPGVGAEELRRLAGLALSFARRAERSQASEGE